MIMNTNRINVNCTISYQNGFNVIVIVRERTYNCDTIANHPLDNPNNVFGLNLWFYATSVGFV